MLHAIRAATVNAVKDAGSMCLAGYALMGLCCIFTQNFPTQAVNNLLLSSFCCSIALLWLGHMTLLLMKPTSHKTRCIALFPGSLPTIKVIHSFFWTFLHECGHFFALSLWFKSPNPTITIFPPGGSARGVTEAFKATKHQTLSWAGKMISPKLLVFEHVLYAGVCMEMFVCMLICYRLCRHVHENFSCTEKLISPTYLTAILHFILLSLYHILEQVFLGHDMFVLTKVFGGSTAYYTFLCMSQALTLGFLGHYVWKQALQPVTHFLKESLIAQPRTTTHTNQPVFA